MPTLTFDNGKFYLSKLSHVSLAKKLGLKWDAESLRWYTRNPHKAQALRRFADERAELKFKTHFITEFAPPEHIPYPNHLNPKPYQLETAWHVLTRSPAYNADEAGLGKTITSVLCMNATPGKTLIVCPPFLKYNWVEEIEKWIMPTHLKDGITPVISIIEDGKALSRDKDWNSDVVILPDSLIIKSLTLSMIKARKWKWLFVDEAHRYKDPKAQRTEALLDGVTTAAERVCYLSGTPIPNGRPIELYPLLSRSAPESILWRTPEAFGKEFCAGKRITRYERGKAFVHWDFSGSSNLKKLRSELKQKFMIRHLKKDVLTELGPKTRKIIFLDQVKELLPLEKKVLKNHSIDDLIGEDHSLGDIAEYRKQVGEAKLIPAFNYIRDWLENNPGKLVVFAHHINIVKALTDRLVDFKPLQIRGGMSAQEKHVRVKLFQDVLAHRVVVGNIDAIGVGNTLTAASDCIFVEYSFVPGVNEQAEDRLHRLTQLSNVYCRYLALRNSLDERVLYRTLEKQESIDQVMG